MSLYLRCLMTVVLILSGGVAFADTEASRELKRRNAEFEKDIIKVSDSVYVAVGYAVSPVSMIVGQDGLVIIDTGIDTVSGAEIREDFRKITENKFATKVIESTFSKPKFNPGSHVTLRANASTSSGSHSRGTCTHRVLCIHSILQARV